MSARHGPPESSRQLGTLEYRPVANVFLYYTRASDIGDKPISHQSGDKPMAAMAWLPPDKARARGYWN
jgi:hypothetical protein